MDTHARSASLDLRDVIAAWLVCFAIAAAALAYPGSVPEAEPHAHASSGKIAPAHSYTASCAAPRNPASPRV